MRVLHVYRTFFPETQGGLEEAILQICLGGACHEVESRVLTLAAIPAPDMVCYHGVEVYRAPRWFEPASCGIGPAALSLLKRQLHWADMVHYHYPWPFADILHFLGGGCIPSLLTYHSDVIRQRWLGMLYRPLRDRFLRSMSVIVATSPAYVATSPVLSRYPEPIRVIPLGIDESRYPPVEAELLSRLRDRYGEGFFLFIGVLRYYKGLQFLLEAARGLAGRVLIVGSGPEDASLRRRATELGLDQVHFLGQVSDREKVCLLSLARAVVLPSHLRSEAFGVSLLEGAMSGKALISTALGTGTDFVNLHSVTGLVVAPADALQLRQAMRELLDDELAARMGAAARRRYEDLFTGQRMGRSYARLYAATAAGIGMRGQSVLSG